MLVSLPGLGIATTFAVFQIWGIVFVLSAMLYICVRYVIAFGPRCFRCLMFMLSGPVELLFLALFMDAIVCSFVIVMGVVCKDLVCLSMYLRRLFVLCMMVFTNCLFRASAFCLFVVAILLFAKVIVLLCMGVGFLFARADIVFHSVCVFLLWSHWLSRCSFHRFVLWR